MLIQKKSGKSSSNNKSHNNKKSQIYKAFLPVENTTKGLERVQGYMEEIKDLIADLSATEENFNYFSEKVIEHATKIRTLMGTVKATHIAADSRLATSTTLLQTKEAYLIYKKDLQENLEVLAELLEEFEAGEYIDDNWHKLLKKERVAEIASISEPSELPEKAKRAINHLNFLMSHLVRHEKSIMTKMAAAEAAAKLKAQKEQAISLALNDIDDSLLKEVDNLFKSL